MNWKNWLIVVLLSLFSCLFNAGAWAASKESPPAGDEEMNINDAVEMIRTIYQAEYKDLLQSELNLTEEESKSFWPAYNRYHSEMYEVNSWLLGLIEQLGILEEQKTTGKQDAVSLIRQSFDMERKALEIKQSNLDTFSTILPPDKLIRFYQMENKANALVRVRLAEAIPLKSLKK
ncbi:hypothetical protein PCS_01886 [Desulfocurvibacter africanus PCS]|uniref:Uncharacterized protein n=1 Tax=Desulfocurvibacter africanus PCS TaxID=1262666 RepID=M5Q2F3_DESAF|nr:hypothetical protein PCS_01886 [Desulfocurvibacter africanus PCS]